MGKRFLKQIICIFVILSISISGVVFAEEQVKQPEGTTDNDIYGLDNNVEKDTETPAEIANLSFGDVEGIEDARKIGFLVKVDFMRVEEGKFRPSDNFTRYEFSYAINKILNGTGIIKNSAFNDLSSSDERYQVMSFAYENGFIKLYNDKTIRPDETISAKEMIRVFLIMMGYGDTVEFYNNKGWDGVQKTADQIDILKGITRYESESVTRLEAAKFIYNAVCEPVNKTKSVYNSNGSYSVENIQNPNITLLSKYHDIYKEEGIVNSTLTSGLGDCSPTVKGEIRIEDIQYKITDISAYDYFGYNTEFFYKDDGGYTSEREIIYISKNNDVEELTVSSDDIISYENNILSYYQDGKQKKASVKESFELIKNGKAVKNCRADEILPENGSVTLAANHGGDYDTMIVWDYYNVVAKSISTKDDTLKISFDYQTAPIEIDVEDTVIDIFEDSRRIDTAITTTEYYDGDGNKQVRVNLPNIPKGALVSIFASDVTVNNGRKCASPESLYIKIVVNTKTVEGTVASVTYDGKNGISEIAVSKDDKEKSYKVSSDNYLYETDKELQPNLNGKFYFDCNDNLAAWDYLKTENGLRYGYLINAILSETDDDELILKVLTTDDEIKRFTCAKNVKLNGTNEKNKTKLLNRLSASAKMANSSYTISQVIKYKFNNDGEVNEIETITASLGVAEGYSDGHLHRDCTKKSMAFVPGWGNAFVEYEYTDSVDYTGVQSNMRIEMTHFLGAPEVFFCVPEIETKNDDSDFSVSDEWPSGSSEWQDTEIYDASDAKVPGAAVVYAKAANSYLSRPIMVIDKITENADEDGIAYNCISGIVGTGGYVDYKVDEDCDVSELKKGDVVLFSGKKSTIYSYEKVGNVLETAKQDMAEPIVMIKSKNKAPESDFYLYTTTYEAFDFSEKTKSLILQRGILKEGSSEREYQRVSWWVDEWRSWGGAVTVEIDVDSGKMSIQTGTYGDIKTACEYSDSGASRIMLIETYGYGMRFIVIINKI